MSGVIILGAAIVIFLIAYVTYGSWLAKQWGVDPKRDTGPHRGGRRGLCSSKSACAAGPSFFIDCRGRSY